MEHILQVTNSEVNIHLQPRTGTFDYRLVQKYCIRVHTNQGGKAFPGENIAMPPHCHSHTDRRLNSLWEKTLGYRTDRYTVI